MMSPVSDQSHQAASPSAADEEKFKVRSRIEISSILSALQQAGSLVTAYFGAGNDFILTCVLRVDDDEDEVVLDYGADAATNQRALKASSVTFVAAHERIKIQFSAESLRKVQFDHRNAFSIALPPALLRLQRREYFRIVTPLARPLKCAIPPQGGDIDLPVEATVVDISCGGVALVGFSTPGGVDKGMCLRGCQIQLGDAGVITADLQIKNTFEVTLKNGSKHLHAGCEFVNMPEHIRANIQRYINAMQREHRNRAGGK